MWITGDVELPDEILDAHEDGELVFFVGAGASLGKPSNLPLFDGLARKLARLASHPYSKRGGLDFFIGQLESLPQPFDAHQHAQALIANPSSKFNQLHSAIVDLAGIGGEFRVVTTNYDDHLASASESLSITVPDKWYAPALPLGRDFAGLVHLHGSVKRPKEEMILTDRDFGHAYITDAWAARFLLPMFERFTVVFVGYSHDDVIMRYLALGLPSSGTARRSKRFALTSDPSNGKWEYLGITPIAYPTVGRDHGALVTALVAWADRAKMGQTDHQARVQSIVEGGTTLPLPDRDYLLARLRTADGARDFAVAAGALSDEAKLDWLVWLEDLPEFRALFSTPAITDATAILGSWFARMFITSVTLNGAALQTIQRLGQSMNSSAFQSATWAAHELSKNDAVAGSRWKAFLATSIYAQSAPLRSDLLMPFLPDASAPSMAVVRAALRPFLKLQRRWFVDEAAVRFIPPDATVTWNAEDYALAQHLQLVVQTCEPADRSLGGALEDAILAAYDLLDAYHGVRGWDPLSRHRSAIEPHEQDELREPLDAIIEGLREYGVKALEVWTELPDRWWDLERGLMRRLALHLVAAHPGLSADGRLEWLLARAGLYEDGLKHETYQVLAAGIPAASPAFKQRVLDAVSDGPSYPDDIEERERHVAYAKYNLLAWLTQHDPAWEEARAAFERIQSEYEGFAVREHPDFDSWTTVGTWGGTPPIDIDEFIVELEEDVDAGLSDLLEQDYSEVNFDQPEWSDALDLVRRVVERRPDLGERFWDAVAMRDGLGDRQLELWRAIAEGWGKASLGDSGVEVLARLEALVRDVGSAYVLGRFLFDQIRAQVELDESPTLEGMRNLARALWAAHGEGFTYERESTPLSFAPLYLNSWPGFLAQYWGSEVDRRWRHSRASWSGLSEDESGALLALLSAGNPALDATQPAIAGELYFYFAADPEFATAHLLPMFGDPRRHAYAWYPYLHHARVNDRLLQAGLFEHMIAEVGRLEELPDDDARHAFLGLAASVVSYSGVASADRRRLLDQIVIAANGSHAADFAETVARFVRKDGVDGAEVWRRWLGKHLERRVHGQPRVASGEELARWADVVPYVGQFVPAAVAMLSGHGIGLGQRFFRPEFAEGVLDTHGAEISAFFAERVRNTDVLDYMVGYSVRQLVDALRDAIAAEAAQPLIDAASERGL